ncbi:MAG: hypothetical protein IH606_18335 [Burkholderiales bacterium]|nr:hypothetical protein [Burkholderiales bacterium]
MSETFIISANMFEPPFALRTAVLFLVFNRPQVTAQVFNAIRQAKPPRLYVAADGPRANRPGEAGQCDEVRRIASSVDWPCEVKTLFRDQNLGCKAGVSTAISWFFENESEGIIVEDDCLPSLSFFWFCESLLERYRDDARIWQICGSAFVAESIALEREASYIFSKYGPIWGWASWRRAWAHYDVKMVKWPHMKEALWLNSAYDDANEREEKLIVGEKLYRNEINTWDFQWGFVKNYQSALSIVPTRNLVSNIGFGTDATHTKSGKAPVLNRSEIILPIQHPEFILADAEHDRLYCESAWGRRGGWIGKIIHRLALLILRREKRT